LSFRILERDLWRLEIWMHTSSASNSVAFINALLISVAFGGRIVLVCAPRFIRIAFGGRIVLVGLLLGFRAFP
jgi:hypothetical protein